MRLLGQAQPSVEDGAKQGPNNGLGVAANKIHKASMQASGYNNALSLLSSSPTFFLFFLFSSLPVTTPFKWSYIPYQSAHEPSIKCSHFLYWRFRSQNSHCQLLQLEEAHSLMEAILKLAR